MTLLVWFLALASVWSIAGASPVQLWLSISAQHRQLEVSWENAKVDPGDMILVTNQEPYSFERVKATVTTGSSVVIDGDEGSGSGQSEDYAVVSSEPPSYLSVVPLGVTESAEYVWISNGGLADVSVALRPRRTKEWYTTPVRFDYGLSRNVTIYTSCYGYWASYVNESGHILASNCIRAYPRWMTELRPSILHRRMRDLFIPGTHDSGSYRPNFTPSGKETIVTKYALTQDDDIRGQLMHGVRYLDIRVGYYKNTNEQFYVNHGITRQRPLSEIIDQLIDFVHETNEIVIFGVKEFPVGFGKNIGVHRLLVSFLMKRLGELLVPANVSWRVHVSDVLIMRKNIFLAYDHIQMVMEFPNILFTPVIQRWGDVRTWPQLEKHLIKANAEDTSYVATPVADMAELTPDTWGVITDRYGGLRKMADDVNWRVTSLYREKLVNLTNIVAADFIRGTNLVEIAIERNKE